MFSRIKIKKCRCIPEINRFISEGRKHISRSRNTRAASKSRFDIRRHLRSRSSLTRRSYRRYASLKWPNVTTPTGTKDKTRTPVRRGLSWHNCQRAFYCRRYGRAILRLIRGADVTEFIKLRPSATARQFRYENPRSPIISEGTERKKRRGERDTWNPPYNACILVSGRTRATIYLRLCGFGK